MNYANPNLPSYKSVEFPFSNPFLVAYDVTYPGPAVVTTMSRGVKAALWFGGCALVGYALFKVVDSNAQEGNNPQSRGHSSDNTIGMQMQTLYGSAGMNLKELKKVTDERRKKMADEYYERQYKKVLEAQEREWAEKAAKNE